MTCEELLRVLNDYVDGDVDPAVCSGFEEHLAGCNPCKIVVDTIRRTITLYREGTPYPISIEFCRRLHDSLREKWKETRGKQ